jgi:ribokinase
MISAVGNDSYGDQALENFHSNEIDISGVHRVSTSTGMAHIWVDGSGENRIVLIPGANSEVSVTQALDSLKKLPDAKFLIGQCEIQVAVTSQIFSYAQSVGVTTILNPAPFTPLPHELLDNSTWLIVNEVEFQELHPRHRKPDSPDAINSFIRKTHCIITIGASGAILLDEEGEQKIISAPQVFARDTTGAGDCLIGAFVGGLAHGLSSIKALEFAISAASHSVTMIGAQNAFPTRDWCATKISASV